eukprot:2878799-Rhodomonas_salina.1
MHCEIKCGAKANLSIHPDSESEDNRRQATASLRPITWFKFPNSFWSYPIASIYGRYATICGGETSTFGGADSRNGNGRGRFVRKGPTA